MVIETYGNEVRVNFQEENPSHADVSITFPDLPNWFLFVGRDGQVSWYNEVTDEFILVVDVREYE